MTVAWGEVARRLREVADTHDDHRLDAGQRASLRWIASRIGTGGLVLADEVGTGKTRIACAVVQAVLDAGGRAAVVVPRGVMHQWTTESRALDDGARRPKRLTSFGDSIREASASGAWDDFSPTRGSPEWWLISHGFGAPRVSARSRPWRIALPSLVAHALATEAVRDDGRTRLGRFQHSLDTLQSSHWGLPAMHRVAPDVSKAVRRGSGLHQRIAALPLVDLDGRDNAALIDTFGQEGEGRALTEALLGVWLGAFDLVVIDEAHKSRRGEDDEDGAAERATSTKVLARLLDEILVQPGDGRRMCLTATPMELVVAQWFDLLSRAGRGLSQDERAQVERLPIAAREAQAAPDEVPRLEALREAAVGFTRALAPYVTRRRRLDDGFVQTFCERLPPERRVLAHPHRNIASVPIAWPSSGPGAVWSEVLFAAECMGRAAQGLTREETEGWPESLRRAYSGLASGHLTADVLDAGERIERAAETTQDPVRAAKIARVAHWHGVMRSARGRATTDGDPDHDHPRITAAVQEIEHWTAKGEKVLVFGVFLAPMRRLRDVLNARHALRAVDAGRPLAHDPFVDATMAPLVLRQWGLLRERGALRDALATTPPEALPGLFKRAHQRYEAARKRVRREAGRVVDAWCEDAARLGGGAPDPTMRDLLVDHLVGFVVDHQLRGAGPDGGGLGALAEVFFAERLQPLLGEDADDDTDDAIEPCDRWVRVHRALAGDTHGELGQQSAHARLLSGAMQRDETRRYLQAAFNRDGADPHVLIAQSRVGREGLNLHGACRVVVQFHAEWNPAVLEQQIGRVDRKGSRWEALAREWIERGAQGQAPLIEVRRLVFEGTYDSLQWDRVSGRQRDFDASLFGALLPAASWERVPEGWRDMLKRAAPSFAPSVDATRKDDVEHTKKRR